MFTTKIKTASSEAAHTSVADIPNEPLAFLWYGIRPYKGWFYLALFLAVIAAVVGQGSNYLFKIIVDAIENDAISVAFWAGMSYPVIIFCAQMLYRVSGMVTYYQTSISKAYIHNNLTARLLGHSKSYFSDRFAGSLVNKLHNVTRGYHNMVEQIIWTYVNATVHLVVTAALIFTVDTRAGLVFVGLIIVLLGLNKALSKKKRLLSKEAAEARSALSGKSSDLFSNVDATRQYVRQQHEFKTIASAAERVRATSNRSDFYTEYMLIANGIILFVSFATILYFTFNSWQQGLITAGDAVLVLALISQITGLLIFIGQSFQTAARSFGDIEEGLKEIVIPHEVTDSAYAKPLQLHAGMIIFNDVQYAYGENKVFNNFNLAIEPGERVGLVGPSGAGKTTFMSLLLRQHDIDSGAILIDGQDISQVTQDSLRENIAVVPQEPLLFHRSIQENIAYGKPEASDEEIIAVAKKAQAHEFIKDLPEGYDTLVGERGVKLSGGQKQRVAIARAMLKDAPILILDEATSALDSESEVAIQKALHELMAGKTVVAIAHRLSTLREMDRIIVMEEGRVVEDGSHEELSHAHGTYQRLWEHQAGGFLQE